MSGSEHSEAPPSPSEEPSKHVPDPVTPPDIHSWSFWKKRLARLLIVGALGLAATQVLPALPEDQTVEFRTKRGLITQLQLTYYERGNEDGEPLLGTRLTLAEPGKHVPHTLRLKSGEYTVVIEALVSSAEGKTHLISQEKFVELSGDKALISLD